MNEKYGGAAIECAEEYQLKKIGQVQVEQKKSETIRRNFRGLRRRIRNTQSSFLDGTKIMQGNIEGIRARNENWATSRESFVFKFSYGYNNYRLLMIGRIVEVQGNFSSSCFFVHFFSVRNGKIGKNFP